MSINNRRAHARFEVAARVMYSLQRRHWVGFVRSLSAGGMLLRPTQPLQVGSIYDFALTLPGSTESVAVRGAAVSTCADGVRIRFEPGQTHVLTAVHHYILNTVVPQRAAEAARPHANARHICELAALYQSLSMQAEAMDILRRALAERPLNTQLREAMARLWFNTLDERRAPFDAGHAALVDELRAVVGTESDADADAPTSALLQTAAQRLRSWHTRRATYAQRQAETELAAHVRNALGRGNLAVQQVVELYLQGQVAQAVQEALHERDSLALQGEAQAEIIAELRIRLNQERAEHGQCLARLHAEQSTHQETREALRQLRRLPQVEVEAVNAPGMPQSLLQ